MKSKISTYLICLGLFSNFTFALGQDSTDQADPHAPPASRGCYLCTLPTPSNTQRLGELCGPDPYSAICANFQAEQGSRQSTQEIDRVISAARQTALRELGFNNLEDYLNAQLRPLGYQLDMADLSNRRAILSGHANGRNFTSTLCPEPQTNRELSPENQLTQNRQRLNEITQRYRSILADNPLGLVEHITRQCQIERSRNYVNIRNSPSYRQFREDCNRLTEISAQALQLTSQENRASQAQRQEFVRRYAFHLNITGLPPHDGDISRQNRNLELQHQIICSRAETLQESRATETYQNAMTRLHSHRSFVEALHRNVYTQDRQRHYSSITEAARQGVIRSLPQTFSQAQGLGQVAQSFQPVVLSLPQLPPTHLYRQIDGQQYLDPTRVPNSNSFATTLIRDPSLDLIRGWNAYYNQGSSDTVAHVSAHGAALANTQTNPHALFAVMAHEFGHHIDANREGANVQNWEALTACLRRNSAIRHEIQRGEATSDYIESSVLAHELSFLPMEQRRNVAVESLKFHCEFHGTRTDRTHPPGQLRVNAIIFANPRIRQVLNCNEDNYSYRLCPEN